MSEYLGKLLFSNVGGVRQLIYVNAICRNVYSLHFYSERSPAFVEEHYADAIEASISNKELRIINQGDKIYSKVGKSFTVYKTTDECINLDSWGASVIPYNRFFDHFRFAFEEEDPKITNNKGRKTCFSCKCPTENRRDFNDMSIREMCPRCKF